MSVSRILSNMSVETFASLGHCATIGKQWLEEYNKTREGPTKNSIEMYFNNITSKKETLSTLKKILEMVTKNKDLLMGVLSETLYTYYDAKATVDSFIDELKYYSYNFETLYCDIECVPFQLDFTVRQQELPILGRVFCPAVLSNSVLRLQITDEECLPYLIVLKRIIDDSDCFQQIGKKHGQRDVAFIEDFSAQHYCPMLIFDDADLDSAVNALVSASWSYQGAALWSLTHVYIQEALYNEAIAKIKSLTSRFWKSNSFYFRHYENCISTVNNEKVGDLEIFQPSLNLPHRFFIGWDPRDFTAKVQYNMFKLGLAILPFRTDNEGVALVNKSLYAVAASIWTERIGRANSISKKLDMGTVWINCHGIIKPEIPFDSRKQSKIPFNGLKLLQLLQIPKNGLSLPRGNFTMNSNNLNLVCVSMNDALNSALQASSILKSVDNNSLWESLDILISKNKQIYESNNLTKYKFMIENSVKSFEDLKVDTVCWKEANKVLVFEVTSVTAESMTYISWFVYASIGLRNAVIIVASTVGINKLITYDCFKFTSLPKGCISFISKNTYKPRDLIENSVIQKQIIMSEYDVEDVSLNHMGYLTKIPKSSVMLLPMMEVFLVGVKAIWWPN
ncbi:uncharacterized protein LOC106666135 [Cimex lectularius]|uniref:Aldehyde dehydrogenase domain-containing protein n=1 Tax=Cimex lectularius TaxID=79782 RepID=A0A8I6TE40_CIMLE|nr:uncharacterized protein LOC106666135 [Cimex lectularius]